MIGMGSVKGKCNSKKRRKRVNKNFVRQKRGTFFGKEVLRKMCEKPCQKRNADGSAIFKLKDVPIIYVKGGVMKHPCRTVYQ